MRYTQYHTEPAPEYKADAYTVDGWRGIAWHVVGWHAEADEDTEWTGLYNRTGQLVCVMVGDDKGWLIDPEDLTAITEDDYCPGCGQTGCHCYR